MSLASVAASIATAPPPAHETAREAGGGAGAGAKFSNLLDTFGAGKAQNEAVADGSSEVASAAPATAAATDETTTVVRTAPDLDAALAKISRAASNGGGSLSAGKSRPATPTIGSTVVAADVAAAVSQSVASASAGGTKRVADTSDSKAPPNDSDSDASTDASNAATGAGVSDLLYSALIAPGLAASAFVAPAVSESVLRALHESISAAGSGAPSGASPAATASQADKTDAGGANASLRSLVGDDPDFVVAAAQTRTFLGFDGASRATLTSAQFVAAAAASATGAALPAALTGSTGQATAGASQSARRAAAAAGAPASSSANETASPAGSTAPLGVRQLAASAKSGDWQGDAPSQAASAQAANSDSVVAGLANPLAGAITLAQLPDVLADAADELSAAVGAATATGASAAATQPVKELQLDLQPGELGSVQVTMRLANGKLSIVVGVAKASTLSAIEGERDAIAARLGADGSNVDSLVVTQLNTSTATTAAADSPEGAPAGSQDNASNGANGDAPTGGGGASRRNGASDAGRRQSAAQSMPSRRSSGDLLV